MNHNFFYCPELSKFITETLPSEFSEIFIKSLALPKLAVTFCGSSCIQSHENEKEKLVMEEEAMVQEQSSLESQLASLKAQITTLTTEVDEQRAKVIIVTTLG